MTCSTRELIREARLEAGLTQVELAEKMGCLQTHISRLETASLSVTVHTLERIAKALDRELEIRFR